MSGGLPSGSSIPGAVQAFITLAKSALPANTTVWFGHTPPAYETPITLHIERVTGDQHPAELGPSYRREETFSIYATLISYAGDVDFVSRMTEAFSAFNLIAFAVGNNPTLSGAVRYAEVGNFDMTPETDANDKGAVFLAFDVRCSQRVTSLS